MKESPRIKSGTRKDDGRKCLLGNAKLILCGMKKSKDSLLRKIARDAEREAIRLAIATHGNRVRAAQSLGITTQTLRQKMGSGK